MNALRVRAARPDDYDTIAAVADDWWGRPIGAAFPRLFLDHFHQSSRVVEDDHGLAALLVAFFSPSQPHVAYIHFVGVRPDQRRGGWARRLYEEFFHRARAAGCREVHAITGPGNTSSIAFHRRLGFVVGGPVSDYNGPGRPMVTFRRPLTDG
ncbi:GNAT family N-acetyltransferase [Pseudofrankia asymbiotica]|uniref:GNAT family N-acetyltransferase n=1 Tax=Pseudofrankia asymbiotica TaxID=1834516 RepID=A0A1V2I804_9ACTN|nr:GNAT family N-acetyltransferase [Pseudofrankia asymbiotica]ONH27541.1 GNAT family N-acetyltransferase [Pseudofrankia asymbiotica]